MPASQTRHESFKLDETEFALAISACPQIEQPKGIVKNTEVASRRSGVDRRRAQRPSQTVFDDHDLTETLTIGWAIALAIAVALAVYVSGA